MTRSRRSDRFQLELGEQQPTLEDADEDEEDDPCLSPEWCEGPEVLEEGRLCCWGCYCEATDEQREAYADADQPKTGPAPGDVAGISRKGP